MSRRTYTDYLRDIFDAAGYALSFVADADLNSFMENREKSFAVTRALEIIGEAARQVPPEVQQRYPELPWPEMIGMRNVVVHEYFGVDLEVIWRTVHEDLPPLRAALGAVLDKATDMIDDTRADGLGASPVADSEALQPGQRHTEDLAMFETGRIYHRRTELHDVYGGNRQSGIASCRDHPFIFLFSAPSGKEFGYKDGWLSPEEYVYTGEGQHGDMDMLRGNRAISDHAKNGRQLHLFEYSAPGEYRYLGMFEFRAVEHQTGKDVLGRDRRIIRFHLGLIKY